MRLMKKLYLPLLVATLVVGCGDKKNEAASEEKSSSQVAAKVNGTELTVHQVNFALQRFPNLDMDQSKAASLQVVRNLVDQEVIAQKAVSEKLDRDPSVVQALDAARRQILTEVYMTRKLGAPIAPSDAEVSEYFDKHPELFSKRKIYRLQEISIKAPKEKQAAIRQQLEGAKTLNDFVVWLKAEGFAVNATQAVKPAEELPTALLAKLAEMPDGRAMVVNVLDGMKVIMMADSLTQPFSLDHAKQAITQHLQNVARQKAAKAELDALKAAAKIEYMGEFVEAGKESASAEKTADPATETAKPTVDAKPAAAQSSDADAISKGVSGLK